MKIAVGNDHAGYLLKKELVAWLNQLGHEVIDLGHDNDQSVDYPRFGIAVAQAVVAGEADRGIVICGTGVGISIAANKVKGARCVCCSEPYSARLSRLHNDSNILAFGARVVGGGLAQQIVESWLDADFEGGRHADRLSLIGSFEDQPA